MKRRRSQRSSASRPASRPSHWGKRRWWVMILVVALLGAGGAMWALAQGNRAELYGYEVVAAYPHDRQAYCQGLVIADGELYEGTGRYGASEVRRVDLETGRPLQRVALDDRLFGEGITVWQDKIIQLTWRENTGIIYDRQTLEETGRFHYVGQGWGLTHDGEHLIMSDGSPTLRFLDPETFRVVKRVVVRDQGRRVRQLNELEYINGEIFANVWRKDYIARISPQSGKVTGWIDLRSLLPHSQRASRENVLNGIAYDAENGRLFVTGKNWPQLFEIRLTRPRRN